MQCCFKLAKTLESHPDDAKQTYILVPEICKSAAQAMHKSCIFLAPGLVLVICWQCWVHLMRSKTRKVSKNCCLEDGRGNGKATYTWILSVNVSLLSGGEGIGLLWVKCIWKLVSLLLGVAYYAPSKYLVTVLELFTRADLPTVWLRNTCWKYHIS